MTTAAGAPGPGPVLQRRRRRPLEQLTLLLLGAAAVVSVLVTIGIVVTLVTEGADFFSEVNTWDFLTGTVWQPVNGEFGVLPLLVASLWIAGIAAVVAVPLGLGAAIYLSEYASEPFRKTVKPILELLAGMPTIVLGFFALESITPALQDVGILPDGQLFSALSAGIVVGILITPLISSLSEDAMRAVPRSMREGAYGLGATKRIVSVRVVLPAALSGVMAAIVLAVSRAVGETMAVTLAAGTQPNLTSNPLDPMQTITAYIVAISKGEATRGSLQYTSIFAVGIVLFVATLIINLVAVRLVRRYRTVYQ
ncbi:MAG: phosphate ABC transporter permease subunit PstC [Thermoleophilia bacterium]